MFKKYSDKNFQKNSSRIKYLRHLYDSGIAFMYCNPDVILWKFGSEKMMMKKKTSIKKATTSKRKSKPSQPQAPNKPCALASHEKFAVDVAGGMTQHDAYIKNVYPQAKNWKPSNVDVRASKLARKVRPRIQYLIQKTSERGIATIADRKRRLSALINGTATDPLKTRDQIAAIAELNRMEKVYDVAPTASFTIILERTEWRPN